MKIIYFSKIIAAYELKVGKCIEKLHLVPRHCRYTFIEMFVKQSSISHII